MMHTKEITLMTRLNLWVCFCWKRDFAPRLLDSINWEVTRDSSLDLWGVVLAPSIAKDRCPEHHR